MNERRVIVAGLLASVCVNGIVSAITTAATLVGATPAGIAVYLGIGVSAPQGVIHRRTGRPESAGYAAIAAALAALVLVAGGLGGGLLTDWGGGFATVLTLIVGGAVLGIAVREFARGYTR